MITTREEALEQAGFYGITCTPHYTPIYRGPFAEREDAQSQVDSLRDKSVNNVPPLIVVWFEDTEQVEAECDRLINEYKNEGE